MIRWANPIFYATMVSIIVVVFLVYGLSTPAKQCQAKGGNLSLTFVCNKITMLFGLTHTATCAR